MVTGNQVWAVRTVRSSQFTDGYTVRVSTLAGDFDLVTYLSESWKTANDRAKTFRKNNRLDAEFIKSNPSIWQPVK